MGDGNANRFAGNFHFRFLDAVKAFDFPEIEFAQLCAGNVEIGGSQSRGHYAAGGAENGAGAGIFAERIVGRLIRQAAKIDARLFDHPRQFAGGERNVDVLKT